MQVIRVQWDKQTLKQEAHLLHVIHEYSILSVLCDWLFGIFMVCWVKRVPRSWGAIKEHTRSQLSFKQKEMFACWSWKSAADCRVSCFPEPSERRDGGWEAGVGATPNRRVPAGNHSRHRSWQPHHRTPQTEGKGEQTLRVTCFTGAVITALQTYLLACLPTPRPSPISQLRPDVCVQDSG